MTNTTENTSAEVLKSIRNFIGISQYEAIRCFLRGEDGPAYNERFSAIADTIRNMPKTYETDGQGEKAIAYLHYFTSGFDFYVTEKDMGKEQVQAFGLVKGLDSELGYISIKEIISLGAEIDMHWTPKTLEEINN